MKKFLFGMICILTVFQGMAQIDTLAQKQAELKKVKAQKDSINLVIKNIEGQIAALKPPVYWKKGGFTSINFNSVGFENWAAGGIQANSVTFTGNVFANYKKNKLSWDNSLDIAYGLIKQEGEDYRKNEDKIDFLTKFGLRATDKLNYAGLLNFNTQFAPGYDFTVEDENRPKISDFMAPAYLNLSLGMDYKPTDYLSIYFSPAAGKFTFVMDDSIAAQHTYIPDGTDAQGRQYYSDNYRAEFGVYMNLLFDKSFTENFSAKSRLSLFNNWTDKNVNNRQNIDVNWETTFNLKITKFIGASLFTHLIYDDDVDVPTEYNEQGEPTAFGPRIQFKRAFGIGFSYKF
ncbi:DUF3078 domain-containing protein [bacterium]|nr:DUF3078 domain-containing protein [bacterium]